MTAQQIQTEGMLVRPGAALKAVRLKKGWSLLQVSQRSGLPVSSLSKFENGKMDLNLDKVVRVALALETELAHLFKAGGSTLGQPESSNRRSITRAGEGELVESGNARYRYLAYDLIHKQAIPMIMEVTARSLEEFGALNQHPGEELLYVIEGEMDLYTNVYLPTRLEKGDSIYFDSSMGHAYVAVGTGPCRALSVCVAPEAGMLKLLESKPQPVAKKGDVPEAGGSPEPARQPARHRSA